MPCPIEVVLCSGSELPGLTGGGPGSRCIHKWASYRHLDLRPDLLLAPCLQPACKVYGLRTLH